MHEQIELHQFSPYVTHLAHCQACGEINNITLSLHVMIKWYSWRQTFFHILRIRDCWYFRKYGNYEYRESLNICVLGLFREHARLARILESWLRIHLRSLLCTSSAEIMTYGCTRLFAAVGHKVRVFWVCALWSHFLICIVNLQGRSMCPFHNQYDLKQLVLSKHNNYSFKRVPMLYFQSCNANSCHQC